MTPAWLHRSVPHHRETVKMPAHADSPVAGCRSAVVSSAQQEMLPAAVRVSCCTATRLRGSACMVQHISTQEGYLRAPVEHCPLRCDLPGNQVAQRDGRVQVPACMPSSDVPTVGLQVHSTGQDTHSKLLASLQAPELLQTMLQLGGAAIMRRGVQYTNTASACRTT